MTASPASPSSATRKPEVRWQMFNDETRRYEDVDIEDAEILPGQSVTKLYYLRAADRYCTIPGDCVYRMNENFELVLES